MGKFIAEVSSLPKVGAYYTADISHFSILEIEYGRNKAYKIMAITQGKNNLLKLTNEYQNCLITRDFSKLYFEVSCNFGSYDREGMQIIDCNETQKIFIQPNWNNEITYATGEELAYVQELSALCTNTTSVDIPTA